jgi:hypothetical protein
MTVLEHRYEPTDPRLGRHVHHDEASRDYAYPATTAQLRTVRHWSHIGILDQGQLGSCTGNAAVKAISHTAFWPLAKAVLNADLGADEVYAVGVYSDATRLDPYPGSFPPDDTGSDGLSVAKVLKNRGLISGYTHAFSLEAFLTAVSRQSVIIGIPWYDGMFNPDANGFINISGNLAGGHEVCVDQINVEEKWVGFPNSWGRTWGVKGRAKMSWDTAGRLLSEQGDVTIFNLPKVA